MYCNIEAERARNGLTREQLSGTLGISAKTYSAYINETSPIPSNVLLKLAALFQCRTDYLLGLTTERDSA